VLNKQKPDALLAMAREGIGFIEGFLMNTQEKRVKIRLRIEPPYTSRATNRSPIIEPAENRIDPRVVSPLQIASPATHIVVADTGGKHLTALDDW
jgi:hypothetical protein